MTTTQKIKKTFENISLRSVLIIILSTATTVFGIYNVHEISDITEGGILGLDLLLEHWLGISPAYTNLIFSALCFFLGWRALGKDFIIYSFFSVVSASVFFRIIEHTPRLFPEIAEHPLLSAVVGAVFVGVGCGLTVREGGAQSGDDALAMALHHRFGLKVSTVYLVSDLTVLLLSLSYIPLKRIVYSLITVILSGQIIELIAGQRQGTPS